MIEFTKIDMTNMPVNGTVAIGAEIQPHGLHLFLAKLPEHDRFFMHLFWDQVVKGEWVFSFA